MEIVPAIIAKDFKELESKIKLVEPYVNWVQLDVMDGKFVPEITGYQPEDLKKIDTKLNLEAHLMIAEPEKEIDRWIESGVKRILAHHETLRNQELGIRNWAEMRSECAKHDVGLGLVLNLETPISVLSQFPVPPPKARLAKGGSSQFLIQLMSIAQIGYHGQPFDERVIPKIRALRKMFLNVKIAVDGGINLKTGSLAVAAGADILVVGSVIFNSENIGEAIQELKNITGNR